jgi:hypothetical protein
MCVYVCVCLCVCMCVYVCVCGMCCLRNAVGGARCVALSVNKCVLDLCCRVVVSHVVLLRSGEIGASVINVHLICDFEERRDWCVRKFVTHAE